MVINKWNSVFIGYFLWYFNIIHTSYIGHLLYKLKYILDNTLKRRSSLPNPDGPLSKVVPSEGILLANKEVLEAEDNCHVPSDNASGSGRSRGPYKHFTTNEKVK